MQSLNYSSENSATSQINLEQYRNGLFRYSLSLTRNLDDAEDLTQETFLRAFSSLHNLRNEKSIQGWLRRIAENLSKDNRQKRSRLPSIPLSDLNGYGELDNEYSRNGVDYREHLEDRILAGLYLSVLRAEYKDPLMLRQTGHSYEEIAHELGIPTGTVKSRIHHARKYISSLFYGGN